MSSKDIILAQQSMILPTGEEACVGDLIVENEAVHTILRFEEHSYTDREGKTVTYTKAIYDNDRWGRDKECSIPLSDINKDRGYYRLMKGWNRDDLDDIANRLMGGTFDPKELEVKDPVTSTGLMVMNKDVFAGKLAEVEKMKDKVAAINALVRQKTDAIRSQVNGLVNAYQKVIRRLNSVIFTLELYAGVSETIRHIQEGEAAPLDEPIYLNQVMRYMDEEVGDPENGGISFDTIDKFDDWLLKKSEYLGIKNYEMLIPQKKGVRIMRVRRSVSDRYLHDTWNNRWQILKERQTYIIIRNGDNIYCIESRLDFSDKLFPDFEELNKILEITDEDKKFDALESYKNGMILMQGLIDRTSVFGEVMGKVSFLTPESQDKGTVVFQYEMQEDRMITDGSKSFLDFMSTASMKTGDRVLLWDSGRYDYKGSRYTRYYDNEYSIPPRPSTGIYVIERDYDNENGLKILYNPEDEIWDENGYHTRKHRIGFILKPSDSNIVNIDYVSHRDLAWIKKMSYNRKDRRNYAAAMGSLLRIQEWKNRWH